MDIDMSTIIVIVFSSALSAVLSTHLPNIKKSSFNKMFKELLVTLFTGAMLAAGIMAIIGLFYILLYLLTLFINFILSYL